MIQTSTKKGHIIKSHSFHMLSIQINTKSLELAFYNQFINIKLSFASKMKASLSEVYGC